MPSLSGTSLIALKNNFNKLGKNFSWLFYLILIIVLAFEVIEVQKSVEIMLESKREPAVMVKDKGVKINFDDYNAVVKKIENGQIYQPPQNNVSNPFQTTISE
jgi:hypothetical protein